MNWIKKIFQIKKIKCSHCGKYISSEEKYCPKCKALCDVNGWKECGPNRCGNCHSWVTEDDKYCKICGTKVGDGKYEPFQDVMQCIYGPMPVERVHKCKNCGFSWNNCVMIDSERFCPKCGGNDLEVRSEDDS